MARITNSFVDRYGRNVDRRKDAKIYRDVDRTGIGVMYEAGREIVAAFFWKFDRCRSSSIFTFTWTSVYSEFRAFYCGGETLNTGGK